MYVQEPSIYKGSCIYIAITKNKARNIAIIICLKVGVPVRERHAGTHYKLPGREPERWNVSKILTSRYHRFENLDLDLTQGNIANLMGGNKSLNEKIYHAYLGLRAYQEGLYEAVIIQFYQVIEKVSPKPKIADIYEPLRDVLSHPESQYKETIDKLKENFPSDDFDYTSAGSFDYNSPKNNEPLKRKAQELMKSAMDYVRKKLM